MDPNTALRNIRYLVADLADPERVEAEGLDRLTADLAEVVEALDKWLSGGGFKPDAWS